jgi:OmpA-OmpF porin, OOP family
MCQPRKWWWGLLPLAALWIGALAWLTPEVEAELGARVAAKMTKDMPWAKPTIEGRDVFIEGMAPSPAAQRQAMTAALNAEGVRLAVTNPSAIAPETKPFTWGASRDGSKVTLSGHVESDGTRAKLVAEATRLLPGTTIVDDMKDARGAPAGALSFATTALGQLARLRNGSVALSDNLLSIKGTTADQATAAAVTAAAKQLAAPLQLASVDVSGPTAPTPAPKAPAAAPVAPPVAPTAPPVAAAPALPIDKPYLWQAVREGDVMTLSGAVPSEAVRTQVLAAAKAALVNGRVVDQMKLAAGVPAGLDFGIATTFAVGQLGQLRAGSAKLTDNALRIDGEALDAAAYRVTTAATSGALPGGIRLDRAAVLPPRVADYTWKATKTAKSLKFEGYYPDETTRRTMLSALQRFPNNLALDDTTAIGSGAPAGFAPAMAMGLDQLPRLEQGEASIAGGRFTISGVAPSERIATEVKEAVTKLVGGLPAESRVTFAAPAPVPVPAVPAAPAPATPVAPAPPAATPPAPVVPKPAPEVVAACSADLATSVTSGRILFQSSKADVLPVSQPVIDRIADVMKRCAAMRIEIAGHTDSTGTAGFNETLSRDRAAAILALLVKAGVSTARMKSAGYGPSRPVADNVTPEGKAKNRRIEFNVVE